MKRYHVVHAHNGPGGYGEFSAADDAAALAHVRGMEDICGETRYLAEVVHRNPETHREIALTTGGTA